MGLILSYFLQKNISVSMIGLDSAGKTTIVNQLSVMFDCSTSIPKSGNVADTTPTVGFNQSLITIGNVKLRLYDIGGQEKLRNFWGDVAKDGTHLIFVVDSIDRQRISEVKTQLHKLVKVAPNMAVAPLLIFANKQDLPNPMRKNDIIEALELNKLRNKFMVFESIATTHPPSGINEGIKWLIGQDAPSVQKM